MHEDREQPFSESNLDSAEYRERLKRKLNCLIAVLEVATAKVRQSLNGPAPDVDRLTRIQKNLLDTLDVCTRARTALEKRGSLPADLSQDLAAAVNPQIVLGAYGAAPQGDRDAPKSVERHGREIELSPNEQLKFARLPKIQKSMIGTCDMDELTRLLQG